MTAGLSCDGDTIAMTGATQPSIAFMAKVREQKMAERQVPEAADAAKIVQLVNDAIL